MSAPATEPAARELERKQRRTRLTLFVLLILATSLPLLPFVSNNVQIPNQPSKAAVDFYTTLMGVPNGSTIIMQTDWTNSTRGENGGEFDEVVRILMRKNCKFAFYGMDPQAPKVARDTIMTLNDERVAHHERPYQSWNDFVSVGYFPNAEGANNAMAANLRDAWKSRMDITPDGTMQDIFKSPVLQNVRTIADVPLLVIVTGTNAYNVLVERLSNKVTIIGMVTGVMGPESMNYYYSKQVKGLIVGLKGVYDVETMMEYGINTPDSSGKINVEVAGHPPVPGFTGEVNFGKGKAYYTSLHAAIILMILCVIYGNISMFASRRRKSA